MKTRTELRWLAFVGFSTILLLIGVAYAGDSDACDRRLERAGRRSVASALKCAARAQREGDPRAEACELRAASALSTTALRAGSVCALRVVPMADAIDACVETVLAEIPSAGRCSVRKLRAAGKWYRVRAHGRRAGDASRALCDAFERAGRCAGTCAAVEAALDACPGAGWTEPPVTDPPRSQFPLPAPDDVVVAFGSYEGDAVSTTSVAGQDEVTSTSRVVIEPGAARLYVVLSSYEPRIWRFEGETSRVGRVVMLGFGSQSVTGLDAERVVDLSSDPAAIRYWYDPASSEAAEARTALADALGRTPDVFAGSYTVGSVAMPSVAVGVTPLSFEVPPGFESSLYHMAVLYRPGGVVAVDADAVVPAASAESYVVLPEWFGLAQLVVSGALETRGGTLYILQPTRFPAGLAGALSASFVLARGVPMPDGDPGHSCVLSEETGLPVAGTHCWLVPPDPGASCELPAVLPEDEVVVFGAYEGDAIATTAVAGQDEVTSTARVNVEPGSTPLYVILSTFDSMIWRFEGATERVRQVVLLGVRQNATTGIAADRIVDLGEAVWSTLDAVCFAPFWDTSSTEGVVARGVVERALGRVDVMAGAYGVGSVSLPSATVNPTPPVTDAPADFDPVVWGMATRFSPGGIVEIDPAEVAPPGPAEPYVVLPAAFGLARLVALGDLELRGPSSIFPTFYIARPIPRFPAGLYGAHLVKFVLGTGVPMPAGDQGHSCVVSEETGLPVRYEGLCDWGDAGE